MPRLVPGTVPVGLCWPAGDTEIPDQRLSGSQLLLVLGKADGFSGRVQSGRVSAVQTMGHGTAPLLQRGPVPGPVQAVPLKCRVIRMFRDIRISKHPDRMFRDLLPLGKIDDLHRIPVFLEGKQEDAEIGGLGVFIQPCLPDVHAASCFDIDAELFHGFLLSVWGISPYCPLNKASL